MTVTTATLVALLVTTQVRVVAVGTNHGLSSDGPLEFAEADAEAFVQLLVELGTVAPADAELHLGADAERVTDALALAGDEIDLLVFFLSSHGASDGAHLGGTLLPWSTLRQRLAASRAKIVVAFVDACQSGAYLTAKGFVRTPRRTVGLTPSGPRGHVLIASSGSNELAMESIRLQSSPFAHHLASALRGGADADGDGNVTAAEVYAYVYGRTVASTADAPVGPQHPAQHVDLFGAGSVVLTTPRQGARLTRAPRAEGTCLVLDDDEIRVLAEVPPERSIHIAPGRYAVKCVQRDGVDVAHVRIADGETELDSLPFDRAALTYALAKGPRARPRIQVGAYGAVIFGPDARWPALVLGLRMGTRAAEWSSVVAASFGRGALVATGGAYTLPWFGGRDVRLAIGLEAGARLDARALSEASEVFFGPFTELDVDLGPVALVGRFDLATAYAPGAQDLHLFTMLSIGVGHGL